MSDSFASREDLDAFALRIEAALKSEIAMVRQDMRNERLEARGDHVRLRDNVTDLTVEHGGKLILQAAQIAALERDVAGVRSAAVRVAAIIGGLIAAAVAALFKKVFG